MIVSGYGSGAGAVGGDVSAHVLVPTVMETTRERRAQWLRQSTLRNPFIIGAEMCARSRCGKARVVTVESVVERDERVVLLLCA